MRKLKKELNITVGRDLDASPVLKRKKSHNGGMVDSADNIIGSRMSTIDKSSSYEVEDVEDEDLLKESLLGGIGGLAQSAAFSVPGYGDAAAFAKFMFDIYGPGGLQDACQDFTYFLSELSGTELGDDFLEPEGGFLERFENSDGVINRGAALSAYDAQLTEAINRIKFPRQYEELDLQISKDDIKELQRLYKVLLKQIKSLLLSFIGFADILIGQKGFFINAVLSFTPVEKIPDFIAKRYSEYVKKIDNSDIGKLKEKLFDFAQSASFPLDYLGNMDLLFNIDKLRRFAVVHSVFEYYEEIDTDSEMYQIGLEPEAGSSYARKEKSGYFDDMYSKAKDYISGLFNEDFSEANNFILETINSNTSLSELYEDEDSDNDEIEEVSAGGVAGVSTPLGTKSDGSRETESERKKREKEANIYNEQLRRFQDWQHATSGRIK